MKDYTFRSFDLCPECRQRVMLNVHTGTRELEHLPGCPRLLVLGVRRAPDGCDLSDPAYSTEAHVIIGAMCLAGQHPRCEFLDCACAECASLPYHKACMFAYTRAGRAK